MTTLWHIVLIPGQLFQWLFIKNQKKKVYKMLKHKPSTFLIRTEGLILLPNTVNNTFTLLWKILLKLKGNVPFAFAIRSLWTYLKKSGNVVLPDTRILPCFTTMSRAHVFRNNFPLIHSFSTSRHCTPYEQYLSIFSSSFHVLWSVNSNKLSPIEVTPAAISEDV